MHETKLYGEVVQFKESENSDQFTLNDVQNQLKEAKGIDIKAIINCVGGDVDEAFGIYDELRSYASANDAKITTQIQGKCASSAVLFFLAGDERLISENSEIFVHNASTSLQGDYKDFQKGAEDLMRYNNRIAKHYEKNTKISLEDALELMHLESSITSDEALALGFATNTLNVSRPAVLNSILNKYNYKHTKMAETSKQNSLVKDILNLFKVNGILNKEVFKADNGIVDFYELGEKDEVKVGDKAKIDGKPASGAVLMASGETYIFAEDGTGELIEIVGKDANVENSVQNNEEEEAVIADLEKQIADLKAENEDLKKKLEEAKGAEAEATNSLIQIKNKLLSTASREVVLNKREREEETKQKSISDAVSKFKNSKLNKK